MDLLGVSWQTNRIAWDNYNPHPQLKSLPKEVVFVGKGFNQQDPITAGLQEVVLLYPGVLEEPGRRQPLRAAAQDQRRFRNGPLRQIWCERSRVRRGHQSGCAAQSG